MGLLDIIRRKLVDEAGVALVDSQGNIKATVLANRSGRGAQSLTSEYEIMRGDLVRVLYDATKDDVTYIFGKTVEGFELDPNNPGVTVHFSDGQSSRYDILVGADGQGSRIRKAILPSHTDDPIKRLGLYLAYWFVPRAATDTNIRKVYHIPSAIIMSRTHSPTQGQAYFSLRDDDRSNDQIRSLTRASTETQQDFWSQRFRGAGWQTDRLLDGMATTDNFYCQEAIQIHTDTWSQGGRVVLLGDAAYCPSPITGMGTTGAFVGAYVLAGRDHVRGIRSDAAAVCGRDAKVQSHVAAARVPEDSVGDYGFALGCGGVVLLPGSGSDCAVFAGGKGGLAAAGLSGAEVYRMNLTMDELRLWRYYNRIMA
ncbi:hypothetical protein XANCAGTX0491_001371 [Xanthoria calcicola]